MLCLQINKDKIRHNRDSVYCTREAEFLTKVELDNFVELKTELEQLINSELAVRTWAFSFWLLFEFFR